MAVWVVERRWIEVEMKLVGRLLVWWLVDRLSLRCWLLVEWWN